MVSKATTIDEVILELQDQTLRESAISRLSSFLLEQRLAYPNNQYSGIGSMLYFSWCTMAILLQEVIVFLRLMADNHLNTRICQRFSNVLTLFQCIAFSPESRPRFVESLAPNCLMPIMLHGTSVDGFEDVRVDILSVFFTLFKTEEPRIIDWAIKYKVVESLQVVVEIGREVSKLVATYTVGTILRVETGLVYICSNANLLQSLIRIWNHLIHRKTSGGEAFFPRLIHHILYCYLLLCDHPSGLNFVRSNVLSNIFDEPLISAAREVPEIFNLIKKLFIADTIY